MTAAGRPPLRLASPTFIAEWYGLHPTVVRGICGSRPGVRVWSGGGPVVDCGRFEAAFRERGKIVELWTERKRAGSAATPTRLQSSCWSRRDSYSPRDRAHPFLAKR